MHPGTQGLGAVPCRVSATTHKVSITNPKKTFNWKISQRVYIYKESPAGKYDPATPDLVFGARARGHILRKAQFPLSTSLAPVSGSCASTPSFISRKAQTPRPAVSVRCPTNCKLCRQVKAQPWYAEFLSNIMHIDVLTDVCSGPDTVQPP